MSRFDIHPESLNLHSVHTPCLFRYQDREAVLFIGTPELSKNRLEERYTLWCWLDGQEPISVLDFGDSVCAPWVVRHNDRLRLYLCVRLGAVYRLALFESDNPLEWTFVDWCLPESTAWQWTPCVIEKDGLAHLFYSATDVQTGVMTVRHAISEDGITFHNDCLVSLPNSDIYPDSVTRSTMGGVKPALYKVSDSDYALFLSVYQKNGVSLHLFRSTDLAQFDYVARVFPERNDVYKAHLYKGVLLYVRWQADGVSLIKAEAIELSDYVATWSRHPNPVEL